MTTTQLAKLTAVANFPEHYMPEKLGRPCRRVHTGRRITPETGLVCAHSR